MRKTKKSPTKQNSQQRSPVFICSFCGKSEEKVKKLVCGPGAFICDGCIQLVNDIVQAEATDFPKNNVKATPANARKGNAFRDRMFEMIVSQALDAEIWKESCKTAMSVNKIAEMDVKAEVQKRLKAARADVHEFAGNKKLLFEQRVFLALNHLSEEINNIKTKLESTTRQRNGRS